MDWLPIVSAALVSILTAVFGFLKVRDTARFKGIEQSLNLYREDLIRAKGRVSELEIALALSESKHRADTATWDKERMTLVLELNSLRATVARMEIGRTAAIIIADETSEIIDLNPVATEMFGWSKEELVGRDVQVLIPFRFRNKHARMYKEVVEGSRPMHDKINAFALDRTGQEIPVVITLSAWEDEGKRYFGAELRRRPS